MASTWNCILCLFLIIAGICDATDLDTLHCDIATKYELWIAKYGRVYKDKAEKAKRFKIFKKNVKYIEDFNNAGNQLYTLGVNLFTDLTSKEFLTTYADQFKAPKVEFQDLRRSTSELETVEPLNAFIPSSVDWRKEGAVTSVKFQGFKCGACWAFAAAATIESLIKIKGGPLNDLSPQQLVDCVGSSSGCKGGWTDRAYQYIIKNGGIAEYTNYPYADAEGDCDHNKETQIQATITGYSRVKPVRDEAALASAVSRQPIAVTIEASHDFQHYKKGVFNGFCRTRQNHSVTIVGYGEEEGNNYWIVKNSWSDKWGDGGYIRMKKDVASPLGICGIAMNTFYPIL